MVITQQKEMTYNQEEEKGQTNPRVERVVSNELKLEEHHRRQKTTERGQEQPWKFVLYSTADRDGQTDRQTDGPTGTDRKSVKRKLRL